MRAESLDHLVLTVADLEAMSDWYTRVLGMDTVILADGRPALRCGHVRIALQAVDARHDPRADRPTPGSAELCFVVTGRIEAAVLHLEEAGVPIELGPVQRTAAHGHWSSVFVRDPDGNLVELSVH
jgi:catechol 2,3-dioxygenase-like lactoylglutathione lyase family enzyme